MSMSEASETTQPALANSIDDFSILNQFDIHLIQTVLEIMTLTLTFYLLFTLTLWTYDYLNTKYLNINLTGLTYLKIFDFGQNKHLPYNYMTSPHMDQSICIWAQCLETQRTYTVKANLLQEESPLTKKPSYDSIDLK